MYKYLRLNAFLFLSSILNILINEFIIKKFLELALHRASGNSPHKHGYWILLISFSKTQFSNVFRILKSTRISVILYSIETRDNCYYIEYLIPTLSSSWMIPMMMMIDDDAAAATTTIHLIYNINTYTQIHVSFVEHPTQINHTKCEKKQFRIRFIGYGFVQWVCLAAAAPHLFCFNFFLYIVQNVLLETQI